MKSSPLSKLIWIAVIAIAISVPLVRAKIKGRYYAADLENGVVLEATSRNRGSLLRKSRILLIDHLPQGSTGVVLSESLDDGIERFERFEKYEKKKSGQHDHLLRSQQLKDTQKTSHNVFWGGPVASTHFFHVTYSPQDNQVSMSGNIRVKDTSSKPSGDSSKNIVANFVGYAGWEAQQLEKEVLRGDWRVYKPAPEQLLQWLRKKPSINQTDKN
ncbi:MAG: YqgE/AlgH family protein [Pseudomonadales bacterium]|nr:YqgE/AlgH family protein [Pseudomonadales bacterium]